MMDPALLRNIALLTNDDGTADAQVALVARRLIGKGGEVVIDPDDLQATLARLAKVSAQLPSWKKYSFTLAQMLEQGALNISNFLRVPLQTLELEIVHDAAMKPTESFAGTGAESILVSVGVEYPGMETHQSILAGGPGYGDGPGIEDDSEYIFTPQVPTNYTAMNLFPGTAGGIPTGATAYLYVALDGATSLADYQALTAGGIDIWLLTSVLA